MGRSAEVLRRDEYIMVSEANKRHTTLMGYAIFSFLPLTPLLWGCGQLYSKLTAVA